MTYITSSFARYSETCPLIVVVDPDELCIWHTYVVIPQPKGFFHQLTPEQQKAAVEYRGVDTWDDMKVKYDL